MIKFEQKEAINFESFTCKSSQEQDPGDVSEQRGMLVKAGVACHRHGSVVGRRVIHSFKRYERKIG